MSLVYADKPETIDALEENIRRVIADVRPQMLQKVVEKWASRLEFIRASRGGHLPEIIFKTMANPYLYNKAKFLAITLSYFPLLLLSTDH